MDKLIKVDRQCMESTNTEAARDFLQAVKQAQAEASFIAVSEKLRIANTFLSSIERASNSITQARQDGLQMQQQQQQMHHQQIQQQQMQQQQQLQQPQQLIHSAKRGDKESSGQHRKSKKTGSDSGRKHKQKKSSGIQLNASYGTFQTQQTYDGTQGFPRSVDGIGIITPPAIAVATVRAQQQTVFSEPLDRKREKKNDGTSIGVLADTPILIQNQQIPNYESVIKQ